MAAAALASLVIFTGTMSYTLTTHSRLAEAAAQRQANPAVSAKDNRTEGKAAQVSKPSASSAQPAGSKAGAATQPQPAGAATAPTAPEGAVHTVRQGDTLSSIARLYGTDVSAIQRANAIAGDQIRVGQQLTVPGAATLRRYTVQQGDTLWEIAYRAGVSLELLMGANPDMDDPGHLQIGEELLLPGHASIGTTVAAAAAVQDDPKLEGVFVWPVIAQISSPFGPRDGRNHAGLDLAANMGDPIKAARSGKVILSGPVSGYGETVILQHEDGTRTLYAHASKRLVSAGDTVSQGQVIALVGSTGRSTGPHLHFEIIVNERPRDPMLYLPKR
jgi:murein DD-endopeptidase MepM/ murein hydrolase activator NlpD